MNFTRLITTAKKNIRRTPYQALAASMVMFLTFFVVAVFTLLALGSHQIINYYESKPQVIAFFKDGTNDSDIVAIQNALKQTGKVSNLKYVSKNEALEIYRDANKDTPVLLELVTANILPASLEVSTYTPEDLKTVAEIVGKEPVVEDVAYPAAIIENLAKTSNMIRVVGISAVGFLIVFAMLAILIIIGFKIRVQRNEIETMKLLGASKWFVQSPYLIEGMFYGLIGAIISWIIAYLLLWYVSPFIQNTIGQPKLLPVSPLMMLGLLGIEASLGVTIGTIGSFAALRRYLKL